MQTMILVKRLTSHARRPRKWRQRAQLHYLKHEPSHDHGPTPLPIMPNARGDHYVFDQVVYSTQL
ncbi:hypothetical protein BD414DRAFT_487726 [Trametes punicea]|nr:hypothetical protein BD414DRAFT_487726 [Trametes punicea]